MKAKKLIVFVLSIIMLFITSCQKSEPIDNKTVNENSNDNNTIGSIEEENDFPSGEDATIAFYSYDEYLKFVSQNKMPEDFIYYESLKEYGKFDSFVYSEAYNEYLYWFVDSENFKATLKIEPIEAYSYDSKADVLNDFNSSDLRTIDYKESAKILKNGYEYKYLLGELRVIKWEKNGKRFELSANGEFDNYPVTTDTAVGKLLFNLDSDAVVQ